MKKSFFNEREKAGNVEWPKTFQTVGFEHYFQLN